MERSVVSNLNAESKRIDELAKTFSRLEEQTAWSIEIYDSDHNKAIFVFGVVTIVFLPLSFFTSYFGMNTVDIREMGSDQADFWTVALPISVGVVGLTMVVAYFGDRIRNWFSQFANQHLLATPSWTAAEAATAATTSPAERITASPHLSQPSSGSGINGGADIFRFPLLESESSSRLLSRSWRATGVEPSTRYETLKYHTQGSTRNVPYINHLLETSQWGREVNKIYERGTGAASIVLPEDIQDSLKSEEEEDQEEDGEYEKEDQEDGEYEEVDD